MEGIMALTAKQSRFVDEYLKDLNATQAAIRAGYAERSAGSIGEENLKKPEIAEAVAAAQQKRAVRAKLSQDEVINGLRDEATDRSDESSHAARVRAWELLGRHIGMFPNEVKHKHGGDPDNRTPVPLVIIGEGAAGVLPSGAIAADEAESPPE